LSVNQSASDTVTDEVMGTSASERVAVARQIVDSNLYMTLATADDDGRPWPSPVWYAHDRYTHFFWVSRPDARHSRNLVTRPTISIVIFDSTAPMGQGQGVYVEALASELTGSEREQGIAIYSQRSRALASRQWRTADVIPPAPHRLYRASASASYLLDTNDQRVRVEFEASV
jgi:uncharacterized protein YhbP (UPF0306 family)